MSDMKDKLLETVTQLRERGINLKDTPALFEFRYPEEPLILFQVMISEPEDEVEDTEVPDGEPIH